MTTGQQIFYEGRVQGVGFRYTVKQIATGFEVLGWVRNLPDGRVELQVRGEAQEVDDFLNAIATSQLRQHIWQHTVGSESLIGEGDTGFTIRH